MKISFLIVSFFLITLFASAQKIQKVAKLPEIVPLSEQKLSDGSAFKGNAAGYLERRSDIIKSWYASHTNLNLFAIPKLNSFFVFAGSADL